jgi:hypothetical protein
MLDHNQAHQESLCVIHQLRVKGIGDIMLTEHTVCKIGAPSPRDGDRI